jgi:hypothetical protein
MPTATRFGPYSAREVLMRSSQAIPHSSHRQVPGRLLSNLKASSNLSSTTTAAPHKSCANRESPRFVTSKNCVARHLSSLSNAESATPTAKGVYNRVSRYRRPSLFIPTTCAIIPAFYPIQHHGRPGWRGLGTFSPLLSLGPLAKVLSNRYVPSN